MNGYIDDSFYFHIFIFYFPVILVSNNISHVRQTLGLNSRVEILFPISAADLLVITA